MSPGHQLEDPARWQKAIPAFDILEMTWHLGQAWYWGIDDSKHRAPTPLPTRTKACAPFPRAHMEPWALVSPGRHLEAPPRWLKQALPFAFGLIIGGFYFHMYLASCRKQNTAALRISFTPSDPREIPCSQPPSGRTISFIWLVNIFREPRKAAIWHSIATSLLKTVRFQILIAASWLGIQSPYLSIRNGISKMQIFKKFQVFFRGVSSTEFVIACLKIDLHYV